MKEPRIFFLRDIGGHPVACVASQVVDVAGSQQGHNQTVAYAYAICNPKDAFKRSTGRAIAIQRLTNKGSRLPKEIGAVAVEPQQTIKRRIIEQLATRSSIPARVRFAASAAVGSMKLLEVARIGAAGVKEAV